MADVIIPTSESISTEPARDDLIPVVTDASTIGTREYGDFKDDLRAGLAATTDLPAAGRLVPTGGSVGQFLRRTSTGTEWAAAAAPTPARSRQDTIDLLTGDTGGDIDFTRDGTGDSSDLRGAIRNGAVDLAHLSASGTKDSSTFLRGDNTFAAPPAGGTARSRQDTIDLLTGDTGGDIDFTRDGTGDSSDLRGAIRAGAVDTTELAADAVDSAQIADGAVDLAHLSASGARSSNTWLNGANVWATLPATARQTRWLDPPSAQRYAHSGTTYAWVHDTAANARTTAGAATGSDGDVIAAGYGNGAKVVVLRWIRAGGAWTAFGRNQGAALAAAGGVRAESPIPDEGGLPVVPEWAAEDSYPTGSLVTRQAALWRADTNIVAAPTNRPPDNDAARWRRVGNRIQLRGQADPDAQLLRSVWLTDEAGVTTEWALPGAAGALPTMTGATRGRLLRQSPVREQAEWTLPLAPATEDPLTAERRRRGAFPTMAKFSRGALNPTRTTTLAAYRAQCTTGPGGNEDSTFRPPARITSDIDAPAADDYILRQRWLVNVPAATWDQFQISVSAGLDDKVSVHLLLSDKFGRLDGPELAHVYLDYHPPGTAASAVDTIALADWGAADADGRRWAVIEAYAVEHSGAENFDWQVSVRTRGANLPNGPFTVNAADGAFPTITDALEEDTLSLEVDATLRVTDDGLGAAPMARGAWTAGTYPPNSLVEVTDTGVTYLLLARAETDTRPVIADIAAGTQTAWIILGTKQLTERYALVGNAATIPIAKLPPTIPDERLPGSILRDNEVEDFALQTSTDTVPLRKIAQTIARLTSILPWARSGNNDPIPAAKLTNTPAAKVPNWWRGRWATGATYAAGDATERRGCWYYATSAHTSSSANSPETSGSPWHFLLVPEAAVGATGEILIGTAGHLAADLHTAARTGWCLHRGDWHSNQNYEANNVARRSGTTYVALQRSGATLRDGSDAVIGAKDPADTANSAYWAAW